MRLLYIILFFTLKYALRIYFRSKAAINPPKEFLGSTIYVSNHAASFMDPLIVASFQNPILFFMTRSDVFTPFMKPILWASHMLPIYRQHDGEDTKKKNEEVFNTCSRILKNGRNLLVFGEGFTDDVFIRRLKPVKKGAVRIGFYALEKNQWKKKIYIAATGINYTAPNLMRSDCLLSTSDKICLNDYKQAYEENPNKIIHELTLEIEKRMQAQITHVEKAADAPFHEAVQQITRLGMHPTSSDRRIPLEKRWRNSQKLAHIFNANKERIETDFVALRDRLNAYNAGLNDKQIEDVDIIEYKEKGTLSKTNNLLRLIALSPFALLGFIHCWPVYYFVKNFVEKSFKRTVFYGSVKLIMGMITMGLVNIPVIFLFYYLIYPSWWAAFGYYSLVGLFFLAMILFNNELKTYRRKSQIKEVDLEAFSLEREDLATLIRKSDLNIERTAL